MFAFQFINSYCALFYVAFWLKDLNRLRSLLTTMLMVKQFIAQLVEKYQPVVMRKLKDRKEKKNVRRYKSGINQYRGFTLLLSVTFVFSLASCRSTPARTLTPFPAVPCLVSFERLCEPCS